jgi:1-acyl-sn-glycerol-3-phosphate acyltransferase
VAPGEQPPLQPGFAGLYRALKLPVVPVAVDSGRLWPRHRFVKRSGIVTFCFGEPIPPGLPRREIEAAVHAAINALELRAEKWEPVFGNSDAKTKDREHADDL